MDWLFNDSDDQIFEDDEALRQARIEREEKRRSDFESMLNSLGEDDDDSASGYSRHSSIWDHQNDGDTTDEHYCSSGYSPVCKGETTITVTRSEIKGSVELSTQNNDDKVSGSSSVPAAANSLEPRKNSKETDGMTFARLQEEKKNAREWIVWIIVMVILMIGGIILHNINGSAANTVGGILEVVSGLGLLFAMRFGGFMAFGAIDRAERLFNIEASEEQKAIKARNDAARKETDKRRTTVLLIIILAVFLALIIWSSIKSIADSKYKKAQQALIVNAEEMIEQSRYDEAVTYLESECDNDFPGVKALINVCRAHICCVNNNRMESGYYYITDVSSDEMRLLPEKEQAFCRDVKDAYYEARQNNPNGSPAKGVPCPSSACRSLILCMASSVNQHTRKPNVTTAIAESTSKRYTSTIRIKK